MANHKHWNYEAAKNATEVRRKLEFSHLAQTMDVPCLAFVLGLPLSPHFFDPESLKRPPQRFPQRAGNRRVPTMRPLRRLCVPCGSRPCVRSAFIKRSAIPSPCPLCNCARCNATAHPDVQPVISGADRRSKQHTSATLDSRRAGIFLSTPSSKMAGACKQPPSTGAGNLQASRPRLSSIGCEK